MFNTTILNHHYDSLDDLLVALSNNVTYAYGVNDWIGDIQIAALNSKKTTEESSVSTSYMMAPKLQAMTDMALPDYHSILITGTAGGENAMAYVGAFIQTADFVANLDMLATALGYSEWFVAPHFNMSREYFGAGVHPHCVDYFLQLSGSATPFSAVVNSTEQFLPCYILDVPAEPPHGLGADWSSPTDTDRLIDHVRALTTPKFVRRYYASTTGQHVVLGQRHYITDLENTQDVLRQVSVVGRTAGDANADGLADEVAARLAADRSIRDAIDNMAVFGNTVKQIVTSDAGMNTYIPRP